MAKSISIIGGGIAGLTAGIHARVNGFDTTIYEKHSMAGGLCTAWKKKDYTFDGCIHWLTGSSPSSNMYPLWAEIGAVQHLKFRHYEYLTKMINEKGRVITLYTDTEKLEKELLLIAPEDKKAIMELINDVRTLIKYEMPVDFSLWSLIRAFPALRLFYKYRFTSEVLAKKFKNQELRDLFSTVFEWQGMSCIFSIWGMAVMHCGNGGYPLGGSLEFIKHVLERYLSLGGKIIYHQNVEKILVENNKAVGIRLKGGEERRSDIVISAADGHTTIFEWLEGKYASERLRKLYSELKPFPPLVYVSLGLKADYSKEPLSLTFTLNEPFNIGPDQVKTLSVKNYSFDKALCPEGKGILISMISSDFEYWENLKKDREAYEKEKQNIGEQCLCQLSRIYPGIRDQVEVIDIATPMTFLRYTGNWKGSYQGWILDSRSMKVQLPQTLPGLENFYMAGHWISPGGGLPSGLITGRNAIKKLCKKEDRKFITLSPLRAHGAC